MPGGAPPSAAGGAAAARRVPARLGGGLRGAPGSSRPARSVGRPRPARGAEGAEPRVLRRAEPEPGGRPGLELRNGAPLLRARPAARCRVLGAARLVSALRARGRALRPPAGRGRAACELGVSLRRPGACRAPGKPCLRAREARGRPACELGVLGAAQPSSVSSCPRCGRGEPGHALPVGTGISGAACLQAQSHPALPMSLGSPGDAIPASSGTPGL